MFPLPCFEFDVLCHQFTEVKFHSSHVFSTFCRKAHSYSGPSSWQLPRNETHPTHHAEVGISLVALHFDLLGSHRGRSIHWFLIIFLMISWQCLEFFSIFSDTSHMVDDTSYIPIRSHSIHMFPSSLPIF